MSNFDDVVCHHPSGQAKGDKYERALQWGVRVVTTDWLLQCAEHGYRVDMESRFNPSQLASSSSSRAAVRVVPGAAATTALRGGTPPSDENQPPRISACSSAVACAHSVCCSSSSGTVAVAEDETRLQQETNHQQRRPRIGEGERCERPPAAIAAAKHKGDHQVFLSGEGDGTVSGGVDGEECSTRSSFTTAQGASPFLPQQQQQQQQSSIIEDLGEGRHPSSPGCSRVVARELFTGGLTPEVRQDMSLSSRDSTAEEEAAMRLNKHDAEAAAMEAIRADAGRAMVAVAAAVDPDPTSPLVRTMSPTVPDAVQVAAAGSNASQSARGAQHDMGGGGNRSVSSSSTTHGSNKASLAAPDGIADDGIPRTGSGLEQQLLSMLSGARRNSGGVSGAGGSINTRPGGVGMGGLQGPRGRRLRLSAWSARPTSVRSSPAAPCLSAKLSATSAVAESASARISPGVAGGAGVVSTSPRPLSACRLSTSVGGGGDDGGGGASAATPPAASGLAVPGLPDHGIAASSGTAAVSQPSPRSPSCRSASEYKEEEEDGKEDCDDDQSEHVVGKGIKICDGKRLTPSLLDGQRSPPLRYSRHRLEPAIEDDAELDAKGDGVPLNVEQMRQPLLRGDAPESPSSPNNVVGMMMSGSNGGGGALIIEQRQDAAGCSDGGLNKRDREGLQRQRRGSFDTLGGSAWPAMEQENDNPQRPSTTKQAPVKVNSNSYQVYTKV